MQFITWKIYKLSALVFVALTSGLKDLKNGIKFVNKEIAKTTKELGSCHKLKYFIPLSLQPEVCHRSLIAMNSVRSVQGEQKFVRTYLCLINARK